MSFLEVKKGLEKKRILTWNVHIQFQQNLGYTRAENTKYL